MVGETKCCYCEEYVPEQKTYALIHRPQGNPSELQIYSGHKRCLTMKKMELDEQSVPSSKRILVHPAALNPYDPLYIGYVGRTEGEIK